MTWIKCKESLPEEMLECLISDGKSVSFGYWEWINNDWDMKKKDICVVPKEYYDKGIYVSWTDMNYCLGRSVREEFLPTHWMPLPEPPKSRKK